MKICSRMTLLGLMSTLAFFALRASAATGGEGTVGPVQCNSCAGPGSISCQYCPGHCGICGEVGVIDHCTQAGVVHLSFDDGPNDDSGPIMDVLKEKGVKASFWLVGASVPPRAAIVRRMYDEGHFIGSHSYTHPHLNNASADFVASELSATHLAIQQATNGLWSPTHYRPPFGELNEELRRMIVTGVNGRVPAYTPTLWNLDTQDWQANEQLLRSLVDSAMVDYDPAVSSWVILMHADNAVGRANVGWVIDRVRARGYTLVTAQQCFDKQAAVHQYVTPITKTPACSHPPLSCVFGAPCGPNATCCGTGSCCGPFGFCGTGPAFCAAGLCQNGDCDGCEVMPIPATFQPPTPKQPSAAASVVAAGGATLTATVLTGVALVASLAALLQ